MNLAGSGDIPATLLRTPLLYFYTTTWLTYYRHSSMNYIKGECFVLILLRGPAIGFCGIPGLLLVLYGCGRLSAVTNVREHIQLSQSKGVLGTRNHGKFEQEVGTDSI